jgi:hypothetical protein
VTIQEASAAMATGQVLLSGGGASAYVGPTGRGKTSTDRGYVMIMAFRPGFINGSDTKAAKPMCRNMPQWHATARIGTPR